MKRITYLTILVFALLFATCNFAYAQNIGKITRRCPLPSRFFSSLTITPQGNLDFTPCAGKTFNVFNGSLAQASFSDINGVFFNVKETDNRTSISASGLANTLTFRADTFAFTGGGAANTRAVTFDTNVYFQGSKGFGVYLNTQCSGEGTVANLSVVVSSSCIDSNPQFLITSRSAEALYVSAETANSFTVRCIDGACTNADFDWTVINRY